LSERGLREADIAVAALSLIYAKITYEMSRTSPNITASQLYQMSQQANWDSYP